MGIIVFIKQLVRTLLPSTLRQRLRFFLYLDLRKIGLLRLLNLLGFRTYRNYQVVDQASITNALTPYEGQVQPKCFWEEDVIPAPGHLAEQQVHLFDAFTAITDGVVLDIRGGGFSFRNNHLLDDKLNIWAERRSPELDRQLPLPIYLQTLEKPIPLKGTIAYLSDPDPGNYYHWMCRLLPLLHFYQKTVDESEIDYFYVGKFNWSGFHEETLHQAGIPQNRVVQEACTGDRLLIAVTNRSQHLNDPIVDPINKAAFEFTRSLFINPTLEQKTKRRLYVQRGNVKWRRLINEAEIQALLAQYGFESVAMDGKTVQEQVSLFSSAEAVVALHGAALTNLLFVAPGTKVVELLPYGYSNNCFYTLASHAGANYFYLQGEPVQPKPVLPAGDRASRDKALRSLDLSIDLQKLERILKMAFQPSVE